MGSGSSGPFTVFAVAEVEAGSKKRSTSGEKTCLSMASGNEVGIHLSVLVDKEAASEEKVKCVNAILVVDTVVEIPVMVENVLAVVDVKLLAGVLASPSEAEM